MHPINRTKSRLCEVIILTRWPNQRVQRSPSTRPKGNVWSICFFVQVSRSKFRPNFEFPKASTSERFVFLLRGMSIPPVPQTSPWKQRSEPLVQPQGKRPFQTRVSVKGIWWLPVPEQQVVDLVRVDPTRKGGCRPCQNNRAANKAGRRKLDQLAIGEIVRLASSNRDQDAASRPFSLAGSNRAARGKNRVVGYSTNYRCYVNNVRA